MPYVQHQEPYGAQDLNKGDKKNWLALSYSLTRETFKRDSPTLNCQDRETKQGQNPNPALLRWSKPSEFRQMLSQLSYRGFVCDNLGVAHGEDHKYIKPLKTVVLAAEQ